MGKPLWGIENKWITREPAYFTRAESEKYPVNNLGLQRLYPSFRTDDYCVLLDGTSNLLYVEDKAGLRATTELSMEFVLKTPGQFERDWLVSKLNYVSGFGLIILVTGQIRFQSELTGNNKVTSDVSMETNSWVQAESGI